MKYANPVPNKNQLAIIIKEINWFRCTLYTKSDYIWNLEFSTLHVRRGAFI